MLASFSLHQCHQQQQLPTDCQDDGASPVTESSAPVPSFSLQSHTLSAASHSLSSLVHSALIRFLNTIYFMRILVIFFFLHFRTPVAFLGMVLITSIRRYMLRQTACHRNEKGDRIPRLHSSTCLVPPKKKIKGCILIKFIV